MENAPFADLLASVFDVLKLFLDTFLVAHWRCFFKKDLSQILVAYRV